MLFTTDSTCVSMTRARQLAGTHLAESGLRVDVEAILIVVSELLTNAIEHTIEQSWRLSVFTTDGTLVVEVTDSGNTLPVERDGSRLDGSGGLGLGLIRSLCDYTEAAVTATGKCVSARWWIARV
ncbi:ATP-binding protein [Streptomyces sp. NPDC001904]|uniref:ATP-binding protein n=1 Tax=Streptomyces sp. NPDC001904 TaxID=3154531 RepID=UPI00332B28E6